MTRTLALMTCLLVASWAPLALARPTASGDRPAATSGLWQVDRAQAVDFTLAHQPSVLYAAAQLEAARSHRTQAEARPNPQLGFAVSGFNPANQTGQSVSLQLTQTLQLTDTRRYRLAMADEDVVTAEWALALARQQAAIATKKAYNQALAMRFALGIARDNLDWSAKLARAAAEKLRLGEIPAAESFRAKVALAQAQQDLLGAQNDDFQALENLKLAMGTTTPVALRPDAAYEMPLVPLPATARLIALGLQRRAEVAQARSALQRERLNEQLLHASVMPGFDLIAGGGAVAGVNGGSGGVNVPLPLWYRQQGELAQSVATQAGLAQQALASENGVVVQIEQSVSQLELGEHQIRLYQTSLLPNAKSLLEQTRQRYLYGDASGYELQDARRAYRQAQTAYGQAYLAYRNAVADLETSIGTDLPLSKE